MFNRATPQIDHLRNSVAVHVHPNGTTSMLVWKPTNGNTQEVEEVVLEARGVVLSCDLPPIYDKHEYVYLSLQLVHG